jgi:glycosyltransferase involved in cell wall biosynthesis
MNKISLAIPEYNTSQYFTDCIKYALEDDFVDEIVVNDDCSSDHHFKNLIDTIHTLNSSKIKLFRNNTNLNAFRNKYQTVFNCSNEWVYLLDSDNYPFEESYQIIREIPVDDPNVCYCPQHLFCKNDNASNYMNISNYDFGYDLIGIEESKEALNKGVEWFNWFVNSGNYIFNRNIYLQCLEKPFKDLDTPLLHADTAAVFYYWLKKGNKFKVVKGLRHHHRLRPDSNWHMCGIDSNRSVNFYEEKIKEL